MSEASPQMTVFRQWIELVLPINVIYSNDPEPTAPRPNVATGVESYAAIEITDDDTDTSTPYDETTDTVASGDATKVNRYTSEVSRGSLAVEIYGPGAVDYARTLRRSISRPDVLALLAAAGDYAIDKAGPVSDEPILRDATREPNASIQFDVQWVESETYETEAVDTITPTVTVTEE